jgi:hypothetical protein
MVKEAALVRVTCSEGSNGADGVGVDFAHDCGLGAPVRGGVLEDAEGINPEVLIPVTYSLESRLRGERDEVRTLVGE